MTDTELKDLVTGLAVSSAKTNMIALQRKGDIVETLLP
jgi:hypothetical protein